MPNSKVVLEDHADGVALRVRVRAGARRSGIQGEHDGALKVTVTIAPEKGKANQAILTMLCKELGLRKSQIALVSGATSPQKQFLVSGISKEDLAGQIVRVLRTAC